MNLHDMRELAIVAAVALASLGGWTRPAVAEGPPSGGFADVIRAARAHPGCLGIETGQTASGRRVIFAWFESKRSLVAWYRSDAHQRAIKTAFPDETFDREPLPDTPDDSGPILAIVSLKLSDTPRPGGRGLPIASIGIELYTPLPGGVAVGGSFAPEAVASKVRGLRHISIGPAAGPAPGGAR
jgi:antibiotic biosynthesis monooxygenase